MYSLNRLRLKFGKLPHMYMYKCKFNMTSLCVINSTFLSTSKLTALITGDCD